MHFQKQTELRDKGGLETADLTGKLCESRPTDIIFLEFTYGRQDLILDAISLYVKVSVIFKTILKWI